MKRGEHSWCLVQSRKLVESNHIKSWRQEPVGFSGNVSGCHTNGLNVQPGLSPKSHIRAGAQPGPTPETRHGQHTGTRSPGINQMPWGTWRRQRNLSTPREERRKEDTPGSSSTPGCCPGSYLSRHVGENQERCQVVSESTLFCPPLNAAAQSTPKEACASPRHRAGGLTLTELRSPCICPVTHKPALFFKVWLRGEGCQFC